MKDDSDFSIKKTGVIIAPSFKPKAEVYICTLCSKELYGWKKVLGHLNYWHECDIDWNTPPRAALELAEKRDKSKLKHVKKW
ncbi:MAG: hypothetical protein J6Y60_06575 [Treponema sp.]|nr:hypothetical protein [Treponema sp.]